jgi:DNA processing protein
MFEPTELFYQVALTCIPQIGDVTAKKLITHFENASAIFKARRRELECLPEIGAVRAAAIKQFCDFDRVEQEIRFIEKFNIQPLFYTDPAYPQRLHHCADSPLLLYFKGNANLNAPRIVNIIGTRNPSRYGREMCEAVTAGLASHGITVVSGLAYGIDVLAHQACLQHQICTVAVLAHGLDRIYPAAHRPTATAMLENGGLLTDFMSRTLPDKQNFPKRNRIVAGISDATIVIESGLKGGSLITAQIAGSYGRDVMALPGRTSDPFSAGCNELIKTNQAALITGAEDILTLMNWQPAVKRAPAVQQPSLFVTLSEEEQTVVSLFSDAAEQHIDELLRKCLIPGRQLTNVLLQLEMHNMIASMPGQRYKLIVNAL